MASLGELGKERPAVDLDFLWFGETMRVAPDAGDLSLVEFMEVAEQVDENNVVEAMRLTKSFLKGQVDERDWPRLMELAKQNHQQFEDLMELSKAIIEAVANLPTGRSSGSSAGRPSTAQKSKGGSSSMEADVTEALAIMKGRPDLKMILWEADQHRREMQAA